MNILVRNLDVSVNNLRLRALFSPYGIVRSAMRVKDGTVRRTNMCWVVMDVPEEAENAIYGLNDTRFMKRIIAVTKADILA